MRAKTPKGIGGLLPEDDEEPPLAKI